MVGTSLGAARRLRVTLAGLSYFLLALRLEVPMGWGGPSYDAAASGSNKSGRGFVLWPALWEWWIVNTLLTLAPKLLGVLPLEGPDRWLRPL